jgi:excisionase family DNA binding protein
VAKPKAAPTTPSPLLSKGEVAALFGVHENTIDNLLARHLIPPPIKIGASVRFDRRKVMAWIDAGAPVPVPATGPAN